MLSHHDSLPVGTVPLGVLEDGMPFGLSFVGHGGSEATLLSLMYVMTHEEGRVCHSRGISSELDD